MADSKNPITDLIPHRDPFLWVDEIINVDEKQITTKKFISPELDVFKGHYPDYPILPGVLLCEAMFQSGALMIAHNSQNKNELTGVPVVTRIQNAKFKREVKPGDTITMEVKLSEVLSDAWFLKGKVRLESGLAASVDFSCLLKQTNQ